MKIFQVGYIKMAKLSLIILQQLFKIDKCNIWLFCEKQNYKNQKSEITQ